MNWMYVALPLLAFYLIWFGILISRKKYDRTSLVFALAHFPYLLVNLVAPFRGLFDSNYAGYTFGWISLPKGPIVTLVSGGIVLACFILMTRALKNDMSGWWKLAFPVDLFLLVFTAFPVLLDIVMDPAASRIELGEYLQLSGWVVAGIMLGLFTGPTLFATWYAGKRAFMGMKESSSNKLTGRASLSGDKLKAVVLAVLFFGAGGNAMAQDIHESETAPSKYFVDIASSRLGKEASVGLSLGRKFYLGAAGKSYVGAGLRSSGFFANSKDYYSAPPEFWNDKAKRDTLSISRPRQFNTSLFIMASTTIFCKLELGFNIDVIGLTFGGPNEGEFVSSGENTTTSLKAAGASLLLSGAHDIGMLKSEFFTGFHFNRQWMIRAGISSLVTEYKTKTEMQEGNSRYRGMSMLPFVGIRYSLN